MKVLLSLSGGMDSASLLGRLIATGLEVQCIGFRYGSKHNKWEIEAARDLARHYSVPYDCLDICDAFAAIKSNLLAGSLGAIPEGHYEAETMRQTVVPGRNMIFTSILAGIAETRGIRDIYLGVHAGDHHIYPDCRPNFLAAMGWAVHHGTDGKVGLQAPYLNITKVEIIKEGLSNGVPYQKTRTCYKDQPIACGKCGSCQERLAAFIENGRVDPVEYESREILPKS